MSFSLFWAPRVAWPEQHSTQVHEQLNLVMDPLEQEIRINSIGALKILGCGGRVAGRKDG